MTEDTRPTPLDLKAFLPYACKQLGTSFDVKIIVQTAEEFVSPSERSKKTKRDKSMMQYGSQRQLSPDANVESPAVYRDDEPDTVCVTTVCDPAGRLVELQFNRITIPRLLLKVISLCIPYQPFLNKLSVRWSSIDGYSIYEIGKVLPRSNITEICLDDSPVAQRNYPLLLEYQNNLRSLSLDRCSLENSDCIAIATKLAYSHPASRSLLVLSLASNFISDEGAIALAQMLRSNRQLRSLNLSGNQITSSGAITIFDTLMQFPLTYDEIVAKRTRNLNYLKLQKEVYTKCNNELTTTANKSFEKRSIGRKKMPPVQNKPTSASLSSKASAVESVAVRAEAMTLELIGAYEDPFRDRDTVPKNMYVYSIGNIILSHVNLSHNELDQQSIEKLVEVMRYQANLECKTQPGLIRVVVEGNPLPYASRELEILQDLSASAGTSRAVGRSKSEKFKGKIR